MPRRSAEHAYRARGRDASDGSAGWPARGRTQARAAATPAGKVNVTDPDSRNVKTPRGWVQGYNAQAVVTAEQIVIAAEISIESLDFGQPGTDDHGRRGRARTPPASPTRPEWCSPTPATGQSTRSRRSAAAASRRSSRPTPASARGPGPAGAAGSMTFMRRVLATDCGASSTQTPRHRSSRCSGRSSSTAAATASSAAADPPSDRNGG